MKQLKLFEVEKQAPSRHDKIEAFKLATGILTHDAGQHAFRDDKWMALLPFDRDKGKEMVDIMAESCRLYDESEHVATGPGELTAIRKLCQQLNINCTL